MVLHCITYTSCLCPLGMVFLCGQRVYVGACEFVDGLLDASLYASDTVL